MVSLNFVKRFFLLEQKIILYWVSQKCGERVYNRYNSLDLDGGYIV